MPKPLLALSLLLVCLLGIARAAAQAPGTLAQHVPADTGLFIEGTQINDLLLALAEPRAWQVLAELAGQPASLEEAQQWRQRVRATIGMEPEQALDVLFSQQFAFVAATPSGAQDAVLLCRPTQPPRDLLKSWDAQPRPTAGRTSQYQLPTRLGVAAPDGVLMFGDALASGGMFQRIVTFADQRRSDNLAADAAFRDLLGRVPEQPNALLFARLRGGADVAAAAAPAAASQPDQATQPAPQSQPVQPSPSGSMMPGPLRGANNILLALHRTPNHLRLTLVGDGPPRAARAQNGELSQLLSGLPGSTLLAWGFWQDHDELLRLVDRLPPENALRLVLRLAGKAGSLGALAEALDAPTCLAIGAVSPASRSITAPPVPALAVCVAASDNAAVAQEMETVGGVIASGCNLLALKLGRPTAIAVEEIQLAGRTAQLLDLSPLIRSQPGGEVLAELHLCWAVDGSTLLIATHRQWLEQILLSRRGLAASLADASPEAWPCSAASQSLIWAQLGPAADLAGLWLDYFAQAAPHVLDEQWWRTRQPRQPRLGIQVTEDGERRRLRVVSVEAPGPAASVLRPGDEILACDGRRFATNQPVVEMRAALESRAHAQWIDLEFERNGIRLARRIPLTFVNPVQSLRRLVALGGIAQRAVFCDEIDESGRSRGTLVITPRSSDARQFPFQMTPAGHVTGQSGAPHDAPPPSPTP